MPMVKPAQLCFVELLCVLTPGCLSSGRDGIPPYQIRIRKQHRREVQESVQVNGRVPLPHIPVSPATALTPVPEFGAHRSSQARAHLFFSF